MGRFMSERFRSKKGYQLGERPAGKDIIKLNANESPFPPSPAVTAAATPDLLAGQNRYADPKSTKLVHAIAAYYGVSAGEVFADSGSDVILAYCLLAFNRDGGFCFPDITYNFYRVFSDFFGIPYTRIPLREDFRIDIADYLHCGHNIILANPNAPTGLKLSCSQIETIVAENPECLVLIDEAYVDYENESCVPLVAKYDNLVVVQTMSKSRNLAGARIGFAISSPENIADLAEMKAAFNPDSINDVSQAMGCAAIWDAGYMRSCVRQIIRVRETTRRELEKRGFDVIPSHANFLLVRPAGMPAEQYYLRMKERGILVRYYNQPRISDRIRLSIGTQAQMDEVLRQTDAVIKEYQESVWGTAGEQKSAG